MNTQTLKERFSLLKDELKETTLVAVSKYYSFSLIQEAYSLGQYDFGESRVAELCKKAQMAETFSMENISWHFIGHLQTNKINALLKVPHLKYIHSIDSLKLLKALFEKGEHHKFCQKIGLFLELKTSSEEEKYGLSYSELNACLEFLSKTPSPSFYLEGLMTIGPIRSSNFERDTRKSFQELKGLAQSLGLKVSMGMSSDYKWALEYGSDFVRIGSLIFRT